MKKLVVTDANVLFLLQRGTNDSSPYEIQRLFAIVAFEPKPDQNSPCLSIDLTHSLNLMATLLGIRLIN
jgi:hypothetical protein